MKKKIENSLITFGVVADGDRTVKRDQVNGTTGGDVRFRIDTIKPARGPANPPLGGWEGTRKRVLRIKGAKKKKMSNKKHVASDSIMRDGPRRPGKSLKISTDDDD